MNNFDRAVVEDLKMRLVNTVGKFEECWQELLTLFPQLNEFVGEALSDPEKVKETVDLGWLARRALDVSEEITKESRARRDFCSNVICAHIIQQSMRDPENPVQFVEGSYAKASPDLKMQPKIPTRGSDSWKKLMKEMGAPETATEYGIFDIHYPSFSRYCTDLAEKGEKPPCNLPVKPKYYCTYRKKND